MGGTKHYRNLQKTYRFANSVGTPQRHTEVLAVSTHILVMVEKARDAFLL